MEAIEMIKTVSDVTVMVAICGAVIYLLVKYFSKLIEQKTNKVKVAESEAIEYSSISALKEIHPYFNKMESIISSKLPTIKIGGPVRTKIFRNVLVIFYETFIDVINELLNKTITENNFLYENEKALNDVIKESSKRMQENGIPQIVIDKFWEWNYKRHEYMLSTLSDIHSCDVFNSIIEKEYAALNLFQSNSYFVLADAENTLKHLNGDLSGTIYKGEIVEELHCREEIKK